MAFPRGGRLLELGNWVEALAELKNIPSQFEKHPQVLCLRHHIHARAGHREMAAELARDSPRQGTGGFSTIPSSIPAWRPARISCARR